MKKNALVFTVLMLFIGMVYGQSSIVPNNNSTSKYVCVKGDYTDSEEVICPNHKTILVLNPQLIKREKTSLSNSNKFSCVKGDYSSGDEGICPNHKIQLVLTPNPDKYPSHDAKPSEIKKKYSCVKGDYSDDK